MKKQSFFLRSLLLLVVIGQFFYTSVAQTSATFQPTNTLPYLIDSITRSAPNLFWNIKGESQLIGDESGYKSLLNVQDAVKTYIRDKTTESEWVVDYGEFKTIEEAISKVDGLKQQLKNVFPAADFIEYKGFLAERPDYILIYKNDKSTNYYNVKFRIATYKKKAFKVLCIVTGEKDKRNFIEYIPIKTEPTSTPFANDIRMLIKESESGFDNLLGELVSQNMLKEYNANKCIDQGKICRVRKYLFGSTFVVSLGGGIPESEIDKTLESVTSAVVLALGKDYSYSSLLKNKGYGFTANDKLSQKEKPIVTVEAEKENDTYTILIIVHQSIF